MTIEPARTPEPPKEQVHAARIEHQDDVHVLVLTSGVPFERVRDDVRALFAPDGPHAALRGQTLRLDLGERDIVLFDLRRLTTLLAEEAQVHVGGLVCGPQALHRYAEKQLKMRVHLQGEPEPRVRLDAVAVLDAVDASAAADAADAADAAVPPGPDATDGAESSDTESSDTEASDTESSDTESSDTESSDTESSDTESSDTESSGAEAEAADADKPHPAVVDDAGDAAPAASAAPVSAAADDAPAAPDAESPDAESPDAESPDAEAPELALVHASPAGPAPTASLPEGGRRTVSVHRSLRSGAQVRFPGDIVVFGDVNPGAELVADGSIVVLGALRGMAHAGAHGDASATVMAFQLTPTILRIAQRQATDLPSEDPRPAGLLSLLRAPGLADRGAPRGATARVARVVDGAVVVEDYAARALR